MRRLRSLTRPLVRSIIKPLASSVVGSDSLFDPWTLPWSLAVDSRFAAYNTGTTPATVGQTLSTWQDGVSESGVVLSLADTAPTLQSSNGKNVVRFASGNGMITASALVLDGYTLFAALKFNSFAAIQTLFQGDSTFRSYIHINSASQVEVRTEGNTAAQIALDQAITTNQWIILEITVSGSTASVYINGELHGTGDIVSEGTRVRRVGTSGGFYHLTADVGTILIHEGELSAGVRAQVRSSLRSTWQTTAYYVSSAGSDSANGWSDSAPFATIAKALSVGLYPGDRVYVNRGDEFRESLDLPAGWSGKAPIRITPYGSGSLPALLGSSEIASAWTSVTGTEYSTDIAYDPRNCFLVDGDVTDYEATTKLTAGTAGSLAVGEYAYVSGTGKLHVNIGSNPTSERIEVPRTGENQGIDFGTSSGFTVDQLAVVYSSGSGFSGTAGDTNTIQNCFICFNGEDGISVAGDAEINCVGNVIRRNGGARTISGGRGDGVSYHATSSGLIANNTIRDNEKGGVVNLEGCNVTVARNWIQHNNLNAYVLASSETPGTHNWYHNLVLVESDDAQAGIRRDGVDNTSTINAVNNTIVASGASGVGLFAMDLARNNIVVGFATGIEDTTVADHNCVFDCTTPYDNTTEGAGSIQSDPTFVGGSDYRLIAGSPCIDAGQGYSLTSDIDGQGVGNPPNIGCHEQWLTEAEVPSGSSYDADALDYFTRAEALGGSFDLTSVRGRYTEDYVKTAISNFVAGCKTDSIWTKLTEVYLLAGVTFGGLMAKLKHAGTATLTNSNFVTGDYLAAGSGAGLLPSATKILTTSLTYGATASLGDYGTTSYVYGVSWAPIWGCSESNPKRANMLTSNGNTGTRGATFGLNDLISASTTETRNFFIATNDGTTSRMYVNGSVLATTVAQTFSAPSGVTTVIDADERHRTTLRFVGTSLSNTDAANLSTRVNKLMFDLGANVYMDQGTIDAMGLDADVQAYAEAVLAAGSNFANV